MFALALLLFTSSLETAQAAARRGFTSHVYTFYEPLRSKQDASAGLAGFGTVLAGESDSEDLAALRIWNESWRAQDWTTHVLSVADAKKHRRYDEFLRGFAKLPTNNNRDYELACYLRWVGMAAVTATNGDGGGVMTDYDGAPVSSPRSFCLLTPLQCSTWAGLRPSCCPRRRRRCSASCPL